MTTPASPSPAEAEAKDTFEQKVAELRASGILVGGGQGSMGNHARRSLRAGGAGPVPGKAEQFLMMTPPAPQVAYVDGSALIPMLFGEQPVGDAVPTAIHLAEKRSRGTPPMNMPQVKSSKSFIWAAIFATAFLVALATTGCQNHTHTLDSRILGAVVAIGCEGEDGNVRRVGTGVAVLHGGKEYLATALHIVEQCDVQLNIGVGEGRAPEWTTVGTDQEADIAVLTTDSIEITQDHPPYADQQPPHGTAGLRDWFPERYRSNVRRESNR